MKKTRKTKPVRKPAKPRTFVEFGYRKAFFDGYEPWFRIGVQTFYLSPKETVREAKWYGKCVKTALETLLNTASATGGTAKIIFKLGGE